MFAAALILPCLLRKLNIISAKVQKTCSGGIPLLSCDNEIAKRGREHGPLGSVRKATMKDLPDVVALFQKAIYHMNAAGIDQWDDIYPDEATLAVDIKDEAMYLFAIDGEIAAVFVLNGKCDPEYASGCWKGHGLSFAVVHRLCVNPAFQRQGIGTRAMTAAEDIIKSTGIASVRLDAFSENPPALRLYHRLGYTRVGSMRFRKGQFYLYEKIL